MLVGVSFNPVMFSHHTWPLGSGKARVEVGRSERVVVVAASGIMLVTFVERVVMVLGNCDLEVFPVRKVRGGQCSLVIMLVRRWC